MVISHHVKSPLPGLKKVEIKWSDEAAAGQEGGYGLIPARGENSRRYVDVPFWFKLGQSAFRRFLIVANRFINGLKERTA